MKIYFLPHLESYMLEWKFDNKFFKKSSIKHPNGVLLIFKLPFPNGSYRNRVCRALWVLSVHHVLFCPSAKEMSDWFQLFIAFLYFLEVAGLKTWSKFLLIWSQEGMSCPLDGIASLHPKFGIFVPILTLFEANNGFSQNDKRTPSHKFLTFS